MFKHKLFLFLVLLPLVKASDLPQPSSSSVSSNNSTVAPYNKGRLAKAPKLTKEQQDAVKAFAAAVLAGEAEQKAKELLGL